MLNLKKKKMVTSMLAYYLEHLRTTICRYQISCIETERNAGINFKIKSNLKILFLNKKYF
jgi:hypothetical protein